MAPNKFPSSYRLSEECRELIARLSDALGVSQAGVIEQAVRKMARSELPAGGPAKKPPAKKKK